ncbi:M13 family metallopeptidase [Hyphomonas sp.]|jgi:putative endopeptidase|uniref:M13 family metallopeptidase n=1 Tax=Hyphomonas sp. TaxID=87 RepID=UPI0025B7BF02|nr:M13 family metallopeptidase [Hyphomonas sp.]
MKKLLLGAASLALITACAHHKQAPPPSTAETLAPAPAPEKVAAPGKFLTEEGLELSAQDVWGDWGVNLATRNTSVHPGDDFNAYVNGAWISTFEIPADRTRYGSFDLLGEKSEQRVRKIIEELAAAQPAASTIEGKVAAYYNAYMNTDAIEAAGLAPAEPMLARIKAAATREDLATLFSENGVSSPIGGFVDVDSKQPDQHIFYVNQAGLGMGDRDYYLVDSEKNVELRAAYVKMLTVLLTEAGYTDPAAAASSVLALETDIAKAHWDRALGRNRNLTYNKLSKDELVKLGGAFPTALMLDKTGVGDQKAFVVRQVTPTPEEIAENGLSAEDAAKLSGGGVEGIFKLMASAPVESWQAWLAANYLRTHADVLPKRIDDAVFDFYGKALTGAAEQRPRWRRGVTAVEDAIGEGVGKVYAARYFPAENKAEMDKLVANLRTAMASNLDELTWMGEATKVEARDKLAKFTPKIGYTEKFETYDTLAVGADAFANMNAAGDWAYKDMISKLGEPIDKTEWGMLPQTVNAYYSPNRNEIVFPAAILQPPFFNLSADPAVNYGAIGGVIGHEMGHGFDDQGSKSDGLGELRNWWTPEDSENFREKTDALVGQYNGFCPLDDGQTCINGRLALGENIGDLGGLSMAYKAYKLSLDTDGDGTISASEEAPVIDGLSGDQRFFMGWAQVWRSKYREEALRRQLQQGPHSPPEFRINGVVRNFDEWYAAFDIGPEHALYLPPEERIRIW